MPLFAFEGHSPRIDPTAFVAPTATLIGDVTVEDGQALGPRWVSRLFERAVDAFNTELREKDGPAAKGLLPVISLHGLRHTYASVALSGGMRLEDVSEQLGHASIVITKDIYGHLSRESRQRTAAQFAAIMAPDPEV